jgi:hypothetical protein
MVRSPGCQCALQSDLPYAWFSDLQQMLLQLCSWSIRPLGRNQLFLAESVSQASMYLASGLRRVLKAMFMSLKI